MQLHVHADVSIYIYVYVYTYTSYALRVFRISAMRIYLYIYIDVSIHWRSFSIRDPARTSMQGKLQRPHPTHPSWWLSVETVPKLHTPYTITARSPKSPIRINSTFNKRLGSFHVSMLSSVIFSIALFYSGL